MIHKAGFGQPAKIKHNFHKIITMIGGGDCFGNFWGKNPH